MYHHTKNSGQGLGTQESCGCLVPDLTRLKGEKPHLRDKSSLKGNGQRWRRGGSPVMLVWIEEPSDLLVGEVRLLYVDQVPGSLVCLKLLAGRRRHKESLRPQ